MSVTSAPVKCNAATVSSIILSLAEVRQVLHGIDEKRFKQHPYRANGWWYNLAVFRLSCCCGLRVSEIRQLRMSDLLFDRTRSMIRVRRETTKGKRAMRLVPLWWDQSTLDDLEDFWEWRRMQTDDMESFLLETPAQKSGRAPTRDKTTRRWLRCMAFLDRSKTPGVHVGRHTFCSHALHAGRTIAEVREAAGHAKTATTDIYLHALDSGHLPSVFPDDEE